MAVGAAFAFPVVNPFSMMPVSYGRGRRLTTLFGGLLRGQYFVNTETGESTWDHPAQLVGGASARQWALRVSKSTGDTYYFNSTTGESCWDAPPGVGRHARALLKPDVAQYWKLIATAPPRDYSEDGPGHPGAVARPRRCLQKIGFVWRFCK